MDKLEVQMAHIEERAKSNSKRLDEHEEKLEKLSNVYVALTQVDNKVTNVESDVSEIKKDMKEIKEKPSKNYDAIKMCIITSIISLIIGTGGGAIIALIIK